MDESNKKRDLWAEFRKEIGIDPNQTESNIWGTRFSTIGGIVLLCMIAFFIWGVKTGRINAEKELKQEIIK